MEIEKRNRYKRPLPTFRTLEKTKELTKWINALKQDYPHKDCSLDAWGIITDKSRGEISKKINGERPFYEEEINQLTEHLDLTTEENNMWLYLSGYIEKTPEEEGQNLEPSTETNTSKEQLREAQNITLEDATIGNATQEGSKNQTIRLKNTVAGDLTQKQ